MIRNPLRSNFRYRTWTCGIPKKKKEKTEKRKHHSRKQIQNNGIFGFGFSFSRVSLGVERLDGPH